MRENTSRSKITPDPVGYRSWRPPHRGGHVQNVIMRRQARWGKNKIGQLAEESRAHGGPSGKAKVCLRELGRGQAGAVCTADRTTSMHAATRSKDLAGGLIYIAGNDSRLRSERMHHRPRQTQVHANNKTLMNTYMARTCQKFSQMDT